MRPAPRPAEGTAVDPITLEPVDEVVVTMLMDNSYDGLMADLGPGAVPVGRLPTVPHRSSRGADVPGLVAEHGFSALVTVGAAATTHTLLFDTGISPDGLATNAERLGVDVGGDRGRGAQSRPLGPRRRLRRPVPAAHGGSRPAPDRAPVGVEPPPLRAVPGEPTWELPTLSRSSLESEGFTVIERRQPSLLLDGTVLITGEVDRTTEFEHGMPFHEARTDGGWEPDPLILDEQALVVHVRGRGLVVLTGCGHAGAVNIARHALRLTGTDRLHAMLGGFHLTGAAFEPIIEPTVAAFTELAPDVLVPAHCTGWKAQHRLAAALPDAFVPNAVGTSYTLTGAAA